MIYKLPNQPKSKIIVRKKSRLFYQSKQKGTEKSHARKSMIFDKHYWPKSRILFHKKELTAGLYRKNFGACSIEQIRYYRLE